MCGSNFFVNKWSLSHLVVNLLLIAGLGLGGCSKKSSDAGTPDDSGGSGGAALTTVDLSGLNPGKGMIRADEEVSPPERIEEPKPGDPVTPVVFNNMNGVLISRSSMYRAGVTYNEYLLFNPMSNLIYPGNVLVGSSIYSGRYLPVGGQQVGDVTWSTPDFTPQVPGFKFVKTVTNPKFSDFTGTMQEWNSIDKKPTAVTSTFEVSEVNSLKEFSTKFGIGMEAEAIKAGLTIEGKVGDLKTHILVKFIQKAYSVSMDLPTDRPLLLAADVSTMDKVLPVYISDIFYGRIAYALISTDHDYWEIMAALQLVVPGFSFEISSKYKEILDTSLTRYVVIGGASEDHGHFVSEGWDGFKKAVSAPLHSYDAVPVAMTLRYADDNSVARVLFSGEYPVTESYFVKDCDEITFTFHPSTVTAKAARKSDIYLWGHTVIRVPGNLSGTGETVEYRPVWIPMSKYMKLKAETQEPFYNAEDVTVKVVRPAGMSMSEFLESRVEIEARFHNTNSAGTITGDDLGSRTVSVKIQDLLFSAIHGSYEISTRRNSRLDYDVTVGFELMHDVNVLQEMPGDIRGERSNAGLKGALPATDGESLFSGYTISAAHRK